MIKKSRGNLANNRQSFFEKQPLVAILLGLAVGLVSLSLIKEDVISTAGTLFNFFPSKYGVAPAETYDGAVMLGIFTSLAQAIAMGIIPMRDIKRGTRISAIIIFLIFLPFDNWTDIVHRSNYLSGNIWVSSGTTFVFYTFGSEVAAGLGWYAVFKFLRPAISQIMLLIASLIAFFGMIGKEWKNYMQVARKRSSRYISERASRLEVGGIPSTPSHPNSASGNRTPARTSRYSKKRR